MKINELTERLVFSAGVSVRIIFNITLVIALGITMALTHICTGFIQGIGTGL